MTYRGVDCCFFEADGEEDESDDAEASDLRFAGLSMRLVSPAGTQHIRCEYEGFVCCYCSVVCIQVLDTRRVRCQMLARRHGDVVDDTTRIMVNALAMAVMTGEQKTLLCLENKKHCYVYIYRDIYTGSYIQGHISYIYIYV